MRNRIISYMLFPFQLLESYAKPALQWWNDDADDDTGEWGGICVFWAGPCVTQPNSASSPPHILLLLLTMGQNPPPAHGSDDTDRHTVGRWAPLTAAQSSAQSAHSSRCSCRLLIDQTLSALRDLLHVAGRVSSGRQQHGQTSCQDGPRSACQPLRLLAVLAAY